MQVGNFFEDEYHLQSIFNSNYLNPFGHVETDLEGHGMAGK
jgi:hypothetical protein